MYSSATFFGVNKLKSHSCDSGDYISAYNAKEGDEKITDQDILLRNASDSSFLELGRYLSTEFDMINPASTVQFVSQQFEIIFKRIITSGSFGADVISGYLKYGFGYYGIMLIYLFGLLDEQMGMGWYDLALDGRFDMKSIDIYPYQPPAADSFSNDGVRAWSVYVGRLGYKDFATLPRSGIFEDVRNEIFATKVVVFSPCYDAFISYVPKLKLRITIKILKPFRIVVAKTEMVQSKMLPFLRANEFTPLSSSGDKVIINLTDSILLMIEDKFPEFHQYLITYMAFSLCGDLYDSVWAKVLDKPPRVKGIHHTIISSTEKMVTLMDNIQKIPVIHSRSSQPGTSIDDIDVNKHIFSLLDVTSEDNKPRSIFTC